MRGEGRARSSRSCAPLRPGHRHGGAARHRRGAVGAQHDRGRAPLAARRRLLARGRRAVARARRPQRALGPPPRGRRDDPDRLVRDRADDLRQRAEPGRPLPLPAARLRRLVGRGSRPRRPTTRSATWRAARARAFAAAAIRCGARRAPTCISRWSSTTRPGRARARVGDLHPRRHGRADERLRQSLPATRLVRLLRWLRPELAPIVEIGASAS